MAIDLSDDELLNEVQRRKLSSTKPIAGAGGSALDRPAYDQTPVRGRTAYDPNAATKAEVAVVRAARTRNPNTPASFDQMGDEARSAHWDKYFKGPPKPAPNFPVASDFGGASAVGTPQSPAQFWKNYTDVRLGRNLNTPLVSADEAQARMNGQATSDDLSRASAAAQADGSGFRAQTKYGPVSMDAPLTAEAKSPRFSASPKTWGSQSMQDDWNQLDAKDRAYDPKKDPNYSSAELPPAVPVSPVPSTRKSLVDTAPDPYPNIDQSGSLPPAVSPISASGPAASPRMPLMDQLDQRIATSKKTAEGGKVVETPQERRDRLFRSTASGYDLNRTFADAMRGTGNWLSRRLRGEPNGLSLL